MNRSASLVRDPQLLAEAEGAHAVEDAEVDRLGRPPLLAGDQLGRDAEDDGGGGAVDVLPGGEGVDESLLVRDVGQDAQLDLAVVGDQQHLARGARRRRGGCAGPSSVRTGMFCRFGLVEESRPVAATAWLKRVWMRPSAPTMRRQGVDVGGLELGQLAVAQQELGDGIPRRRQLLQGLGAGRVALGLLRLLEGGQAHLLEQDGAELLAGS